MDPTNGLLMFCLIYLYILASYLSVFGSIYFFCLVIPISCILETSLHFFNYFVYKHPQAIPYNTKLVICSLNMRGLLNIMKKRETFRWLKMKKYAVYFLQEVHCTKDKENIWSVEWGYSAIFSSFSSASAGICVLFNNNFNFLILKSFSNPEGRFVMVDIKLESKILTLVNIYAPNEDKPTFFQNVVNQLLCFDCSKIILGEDFNLVLDVQKDKKGGRLVTHDNSLKEVKHISDVLDLIDIWPCRLDFFWTTSSLSTTITNADILPGYKTDHSLISIHLANNANPKGPGFLEIEHLFPVR